MVTWAPHNIYKLSRFLLVLFVISKIAIVQAIVIILAIEADESNFSPKQAVPALVSVFFAIVECLIWYRPKRGTIERLNAERYHRRDWIITLVLATVSSAAILGAIAAFRRLVPSGESILFAMVVSLAVLSIISVAQLTITHYFVLRNIKSDYEPFTQSIDLIRLSEVVAEEQPSWNGLLAQTYQKQGQSSARLAELQELMDPTSLSQHQRTMTTVRAQNLHPPLPK